VLVSDGDGNGNGRLLCSDYSSVLTTARNMDEQNNLRMVLLFLHNLIVKG